MKLSLLLWFLHVAISIASKRNKSLRDMIKVRNHAYVIMTKDGKTGRRFIFKNGRYWSDKVLTDYDMALVFENADIGFKTLAFGGNTGIDEAINNWTLRILGDDYHMLWFGVVMQMALGGIKRK